MTDTPNIGIEYTGAVATLWMDRPERHNAFDEHLIDAIDRGLQTLGADDTVRVVVLAGRGRSFSAGADLDWMRRAADYDVARNRDEAEALARMLRRLAELPKPTIARVHGAAIGGGLGLIAACDIAVASDKAVFATSEVKFGLIPATIGPYVLRAIGPRQAARYFLTAELIQPAKAYEIGLVHEVVADDALDVAINTLVQALAQGGPNAQAESKRLIRDLDGQTIGDALIADTAARIADIRATDEARERLDAFLSARRAKDAR
ncbi:enoyl-CoA hydratase/isomerase family protein [Luteimonas sp. XNQY3]|nr:enoyl-CoA hydratase-related protein [Luteimonas sp. XNQY3]MCD9006328.1 enoyl-CoA hydratase/isomerase family protein [Luteimonas sp. XNQY3]